MSCYLPLLSLLVFLALTLFRCSGVVENPSAPSHPGQDIVTEDAEPPAPFDEDGILETLRGETLDQSDVWIGSGGSDARVHHRLWVKIPFPAKYVFDFGPRGMKFTRAVEIEISLTKADLADMVSREIHVYYLKENGPLQVRSETDYGRMIVTFRVDHFSRYVLMRE
jgi:hypothetical protein